MILLCVLAQCEAFSTMDTEARDITDCLHSTNNIGLLLVFFLFSGVTTGGKQRHCLRASAQKGCRRVARF